MKKLIIFDLDGVLFDTTRMADELMMEIYPTLTLGVLEEIMFGNFHDGMEKFGLTDKKIVESKEVEEARYKDYALRKSKAPLFGGIKDLLIELHEKGYILAINTSALERTCLPLLDTAGISNLFDFVAATEVSKSKVEKFKIIDERFAVSKSDTIFITDTVGDVREAEIAEIPTVAVTWGAHKRKHFTRDTYKCLIGIVDTVEELKQLIEERSVLS